MLGSLGALCARGERVDTALVQYAVNLAKQDELDQLETLFKDVVATTFRGRPIRCKTLGQRDYVKAIKKNTLTLGIGPAGTGKTYLAMAMAVTALKNKEVERIVLTRPAVEAGEKLGFLGSARHLLAHLPDTRQLSRATDRKSTRLNSSHLNESRMPSSA